MLYIYIHIFKYIDTYIYIYIYIDTYIYNIVYIYICAWFFFESHELGSSDWWGKQKFEILTIQFPTSSSSSTLQNRILCRCCRKSSQSSSERAPFASHGLSRNRCWGVRSSTLSTAKLLPDKKFLKFLLGVSRLWVTLLKRSMNTYDITSWHNLKGCIMIGTYSLTPFCLSCAC